MNIRNSWASFLLCFCCVLQACTLEVSEAPDASPGLLVQGLGPAPDTNCAFYSSAGRDYWFCSTERNWQTARTKCQAIGFDLATIETSTENAFIRSHVPDDSWIGANDLAVEGAWRWAEGGAQFWQGTYNGSAVGGAYANWALLQPNSSSEDCAIIDDASSAKWSDVSCSGNREYVCEGVVDLCPTDNNKTLPGQCGCGFLDTDTDGDAVADCVDGCPDYSGKTAPGLCGCSVPDTDADGDGEPGCKDECPNDAARIIPGDCGCANAPSPVGTPCNDGLCVANNQCNGAGSCGTPSQCTKPDSDCSPGALAGIPYWFCDNDRTQADARTRCQSVGMDLAIVGSAVEDAFITASTDEHSFLGGSDQATEGSWKWLATDKQFWSGSVGGSAVSGSYTNWNAGEPDDADEDCIAKSLASGGKWKSHSCTLHDAFVCERIDFCPSDPNKFDPGGCGCGVPDVDADSDGELDCFSACLQNVEVLDPSAPTPDDFKHFAECSAAGDPTLTDCEAAMLGMLHSDSTTAAKKVMADEMSTSLYVAVSKDRTRKLNVMLDDPGYACAVAQGDEDGDLVPDSIDQCPGTDYLVPTNNGCEDANLPSAPSGEAVRLVANEFGYSALRSIACDNSPVPSVPEPVYIASRMNGLIVVVAKPQNVDSACHVSIEVSARAAIRIIDTPSDPGETSFHRFAFYAAADLNTQSGCSSASDDLGCIDSSVALCDDRYAVYFIPADETNMQLARFRDVGRSLLTTPDIDLILTWSVRAIDGNGKRSAWSSTIDEVPGVCL